MTTEKQKQQLEEEIMALVLKDIQPKHDCMEPSNYYNHQGVDWDFLESGNGNLLTIIDYNVTNGSGFREDFYKIPSNSQESLKLLDKRIHLVKPDITYYNQKYNKTQEVLDSLYKK